MLGPGASRIVRAGLPDRGALLLAEGLPCAATVRARPVRPSRRPCTRVTGRRARGARDGTALGTVTHSDRSPGLRARQCPPIARPAPAYCRRCRSSLVRVLPVMRIRSVTSAPSAGAWQSASQSAVPAVSRASAVPGEPAGPLSAEGACSPGRGLDHAAGGFTEPGPVTGIVRGSSGDDLAGQEAGACAFRPVVAWSRVDGRGLAGHGSASRSICLPGWSSGERSARLGSDGVYVASRSMAVR